LYYFKKKELESNTINSGLDDLGFIKTKYDAENIPIIVFDQIIR